MARNGRWLLMSGMVLVMLQACTPETPESVREQDVTPSVKTSAIPLARALEQKLVEARPLPTYSSRFEMTILLKPLVRSQPWIRIDPGWQAKNPQFDRVSFVTGNTAYVRLPTRSEYKVKVSQVRLHNTKSTGMPDGCTLQLLDHEKIVSFLRKIGDGGADPDWKLVQIAVWALADDVSFAEIRPNTDGKHTAFRDNHQYATAGQVQEIMQLLAKAGHDREEFRLWREMVAELDRHVVAYENDWDRDPAKAFLPFRQICNFYPLEVAADVMISAFDRHDGPAGKKYRSHVVEILGDLSGTRELEQLRRRSSYESDPEVLAQIRKVIEGAPTAPPK